MNQAPPEIPDSNQPEDRKRRRRRIQFSVAWLNVFMGLINFFGVIGKPRFETYHRLDVARLILVGACFGVALVVMVHLFVFSGSQSDGGKE